MKKRVVISLLIVISVNNLLFTACGNKDVSAMSNNVISDVETESSITEELSDVETEAETESSVETESSTEESSSIETEAGTESLVGTKDSVETSIGQEEINNVGETNFTTTPLDITMYATKQCNIRKGPSTDNDIIGTLLQAEGIHITGRVDDLNWYEVSLNDGSTGYVSGGLLTETKPTVQVGAPNPTTQQGVNSQDTSEGLLTPDQVINPDTGEPYKDGDVDKNGMIHHELITDENGNKVFSDGFIFHRGGK